MHSLVPIKCQSVFPFEPNYSCRKKFNYEEEMLLVEYLITSSKLHHGSSTKVAGSLAFEFAQVNNKAVLEN